MKLRAGLAAACLSIIPLSANAAPRGQSDTYTYANLDYDHFTVSGTSIDGFGGGGGWRFNRYFAAQIGVEYASKNGVNLTNGYAEAVALLPLGRHISLFGSIGGSYTDASASLTVGRSTVSVSTNGTGYRAGGGVDLWINRNWGIRAAYHRQKRACDSRRLLCRHRVPILITAS